MAGVCVRRAAVCRVRMRGGRGVTHGVEAAVGCDSGRRVPNAPRGREREREREGGPVVPPAEVSVVGCVCVCVRA